MKHLGTLILAIVVLHLTVGCLPARLDTSAKNDGNSGGDQLQSDSTGSDGTLPDSKGDDKITPLDLTQDTAIDLTHDTVLDTAGEDLFAADKIGGEGQLTGPCRSTEPKCDATLICFQNICRLKSEYDFDGDNFVDEAKGGTDCDDKDKLINPDAVEICDGKDNNCKDGTDEGFLYQGKSIGQSCEGIGKCGVGKVECSNTDNTKATCSTNPDGSAAANLPEKCDKEDWDCDGNATNGGCGTGYKCDETKNYTCVCDSDAGCDCQGKPCLLGEVCDSGSCKCDTNPGCDSTNFDRCVNGSCKCGDQDKCPDNFVCRSGFCECGKPDGCEGCSTNTCIEGEICHNGTCKCGGINKTSCDSLLSGVCKSGECTCGDRSECPWGFKCQNSKCVCEDVSCGGCETQNGSRNCVEGETCSKDNKCTCGIGIDTFDASKDNKCNDWSYVCGEFDGSCPEGFDCKSGSCVCSKPEGCGKCFDETRKCLEGERCDSTTKKCVCGSGGDTYDPKLDNFCNGNTSSYTCKSYNPTAPNSCPSNAVCLQGVCACFDAGCCCDAQNVCTEVGKCAPFATCNGKSCPPGFVCKDGTTCVCESPGGCKGCGETGLSIATCNEGETCDAGNSKCECAGKGGCPAGFVCEAGTCVCKEKDGCDGCQGKTCNKGEICDSNGCHCGSTDKPGCPAESGFECTNGECICDREPTNLSGCKCTETQWCLQGETCGGDPLSCHCGSLADPPCNTVSAFGGSNNRCDNGVCKCNDVENCPFVCVSNGGFGCQCGGIQSVQKCEGCETGPDARKCLSGEVCTKDGKCKCEPWNDTFDPLRDDTCHNQSGYTCQSYQASCPKDFRCKGGKCLCESDQGCDDCGTKVCKQGEECLSTGDCICTIYGKPCPQGFDCVLGECICNKPGGCSGCGANSCAQNQRCGTGDICQTALCNGKQCPDGFSCQSDKCVCTSDNLVCNCNGNICRKGEFCTGDPADCQCGDTIGNKCQADYGITCSDGKCLCGSNECPAGFTCFNDGSCGCTQLAKCPGCGANTCTPGQVCLQNECVCAGYGNKACPAGFTCQWQGSCRCNKPDGCPGCGANTCSFGESCNSSDECQ